MAKSKMRREEESSDPRVAATGVISGSTIGLLALCIPLVAILKSPLIVFCVIGGAGLAIAGIWHSGRSREVETKSKQITALEATIEDLKERLENVEVINRYEATLAERELEANEIDPQRSMEPTEGGYR